MDLTRCLHITNSAMYVREKDLLSYGKLRQIRWLIECIMDNCRNLWKLKKYCTNDKMMKRHTGSCCSLR